MPQSALVIGGSSDIARETMRLLAARRLRKALLAGPHQVGLDSAAEELRSLNVAVETTSLDITDTSRLDLFAADAMIQLGEIDLVIMAVGALGVSELDELDAVGVASTLTTNFVGPAAVTLAMAKALRSQGWGRIVILSSVAGTRVRKANFPYGSAKAGLDGFALGLADVLHGSGVEFTVVRPGFVHTKMTTGMKPAPMAVESAAVAQAIVRALETGASVVWVPSALGPIFGALQMLPRALWRRIPT